ncbi:MAG: DUF5060 domain-containing protein, partial [Myxococcales bacterium]|nr:DUF5060 domain-containing protein [Myxococcales bacterium]
MQRTRILQAALLTLLGIGLTAATGWAFSFVSVTPPAAATPVYEPAEIDAEFDTAYDNPYDPAQIAVRAVITTPGGETVQADAFWYEPYTRSLVGDLEVFTPDGAGRWRVRYAPSAEGEYTAHLVAATGDESVESEPFSFTASAAVSDGFVRVSETNP